MKTTIISKTAIYISILFSQISFGQNIGINATNPQATLDINGSLRMRPTTIMPVGGIVTVPDNVGYLIIDSYSVPGIITINASEANIGRRLIIDNTLSGREAVIGSVLVPVPAGAVTEYIVSPTEPGWIKMGEIGSVPNPLYLSSSGTTITGESNQGDESGILGINTSTDVAIGIKGITTATNPAETTTAIWGENRSQNDLGIGVYGTHAGTGWAGAFYGTNALKATGATELAGNVRINGEIKPGGISGSANQVLKSNGNGTMSWGANPSNWISQGDDIFNANQGKVGIGTDQPIEKREVNGNVGIMGNNYLEFGKYIPGKQADNGKIAYGAFGSPNELSIVGAGTDEIGLDRKIKMWANAGTYFTGGAKFDGKIKVADDASATVAGQIRWNSTTNDFEGFDGSTWKSFTKNSYSNYWGELNNVHLEVAPTATISSGFTAPKFIYSDNYMAILYQETLTSAIKTRFYKWEDTSWIYLSEFIGDLISTQHDPGAFYTASVCVLTNAIF